MQWPGVLLLAFLVQLFLIFKPYFFPPKDTLYSAWLSLASDFRKEVKNCEKFTDRRADMYRQTDIQTDGRQTVHVS